MPKLIKGKPDRNMYIDAIGMALVKSFEERLLAGLIGNGTFVSGAIKGGISFILPMILGNNKWVNLGATAFMIDSAEDFVNAGLQYVGVGGPQESGVVI